MKQIIKPLECGQRGKYSKIILYLWFWLFPPTPLPTAEESDEAKFLTPRQGGLAEETVKGINRKLGK